MKKMTRTIAAIVFCIYIAAVMVLCFMKTDNLPQPSFLILGIEADKVAHFLMFAPFPLLSYMVAAGAWKKPWHHFMLLGCLMLLGVAAAMATEQVQTLLTYRPGDVRDTTADTYGIVAGGLLTAAYILHKTKKGNR